jgi:hypothetical protein
VAYIRQQEDEEQQQQGAQPLAPGSQSGGGMVAGLSSSGQPAAPQQTPQQKAGSGNFTNLKSWLDAGKGRDKQISDTGGKLLTTETTKLDSATGNDLWKIQNVKPLMASNVAGDFDKALAGDGAAKGNIQKTLSQTYTGPMSLSYDPTTGGSFDNIKAIDNLSATATTGAQLAGENPYSQGARRLDGAMFGADADSQKAMASNKQGGIDLLKNAVASDARVKAEAKKKADWIEGEKSRARKALEKSASDIYAGVDQRVRDATAADIATQARANDAVPSRTKRDVVQGSGATEGNMITSDEASTLDLLGQLVGARTIGKTGEYTPWSITETAVPDARLDYIEGVTDENGNAREQMVTTKGDLGPKVADNLAPFDSPEARGTYYDGTKAIESGKYEIRDGVLVNKETGEGITMADMYSYQWNPETQQLEKKGG